MFLFSEPAGIPAGCAHSPAALASLVEAARVAEAKEKMITMAQDIIQKIEQGAFDSTRHSGRLRVLTFFCMDDLVLLPDFI